MKKARSVKIDAPYLQRRGERFRYRREVPAELREQVGRREWLKSLGRMTKAEAARECERLATVHDALIRRLREGDTALVDAKAIRAAEIEAQELLKRGPAAVDAALDAYFAEAFERWARAKVGKQNPGTLDITAHQRAVLNAADHGGRHVPSHVKFSEAYERDKRLHIPAGGRDERPYKLAVDGFTASAGDLDIRAIRREEVVEWIAASRGKGQSDNTIRRRAECLSAIWKRWHADHGVFAANPFADLKLSAGKKADAKLPFAKVHLKAIDAHIAKAAVTKRGVGNTHVIWTLLKHTGARPAEIAGLMPEDVFLDDAVPFIWIRPNALRRLKTATSARMIPLVGAALPTMRKAMAKPAGVGVFYPEDFKWQNVSDALNRGLRRVGIAQGRLSAGSFRHTMKQALRVAGVREDLQRYALGHAGGAVADNYGAPDALLEELKTALEAALPKLGEVNPRIFLGDELKIEPMKAKAAAKAR